MNLATKRILKAVESGEYDRAASILNEHGSVIHEGECGITWHRLGDDVVCRLSWTQVQFSGYQSKAPYFAPPRWATAAR